MRWPAVVLLVVMACGGDPEDSPFRGLPLDGTFEVEGLIAPVHVARDRYGVAHIAARNVADAAFVQGYVMAHDRLPQMDILRRFGAGTLSELFGALDPDVIETDLEMRMHRMTPLAEAAWEALQGSSDPVDAEIVIALQRFTDGVNRYAADVRNETWILDNQLLASFSPDLFEPWTPVDSLVLGRFQAFALSWTTPLELDLTDLYQKLRATYDALPAGDPRRGLTRDLMTLTPIGDDPTIVGFPNVGVDTGSRSDGGARSRRGRAAQTAHAAPAGRARPEVPQRVLDGARSFFAREIHTGAFGALGPHAFMFPHAGSNNWAIGPGRASATEGSPAILASDQHLQLPNPSIFYPTHLIVQADDAAVPELDVIGVTFPGIPGVILGSNGKLAWAATVSAHDVNDVYLETVVPCGAASCVEYNGQPVPIQTRTEQLDIGALGTITETRQATYELVAHHGPIIPRIENGQILPRIDPTRALSVKYTGYEPTFEIRALWRLCRASTVQEGFAALADFSYGSQNWTMIDSTRAIGWTTESVVPLRDPAAYDWHVTDRADAAAPFFILDGTGGHEWIGRMSPRYVPHAIDPPQGYIATANADPVGATFDGDALNQTTLEGDPLYAGVAYAPGLREDRITTLLTEKPEVTRADMERIQHDASSTAGAAFAPFVRTALAHVETPAGTPSDVGPYVTGLSAGDRARLITARNLLAAWTFETPTAIDAPDGNSAATALFNAWMHFFLKGSLEDELVAAGFLDVWQLNESLLVRIAHGMLARPQDFTISAASDEPILCDRITRTGTPPVLTEDETSCTKLILETMVLAVKHLESPAGFGSTNPEDWRWGKLHTLKIQPLFPNSALDLPRSDEPNPGGFPKPGDNFVVNRSDQGWSDLDFSQSADGPAQRFIAVAHPDGPITVRWQLPGGVIFDSRSPHYRDLLDNHYLAEQHFDAPFSFEEIIANGETRWEFR